MRLTLERLWRGEGGGGWGQAVLSRGLAPAEWMYRLAVAVRNMAYDRGWLKSEGGALPSVVVGNLSVGGTGKTPLSAWIAGELRRRGCDPAIVLRGYGGDEVEVHKTLNRSMPVVVAADRRAGLRRARSQGADVAVLDDAFQHRALRADIYIALVAAEEWTDELHLLPRGPWREPLDALERADMLIVSRKISDAERAEQVTSAVEGRFPDLPMGRVHLGLAGLAPYDPGEGRVGQVLETPRTEFPVAVAGIARPGTLWPQLADLGVRVERQWELSDHHRYSSRELRELRAFAREGAIIATLKDAVKLGPELGSDARILVPVQAIDWEAGEAKLMELLGRLAGLRQGARS